MIQKTVYDNGLSVLTERMPNLRSISLGIWLKKGSRHEAEAENGISHFIEHLVFKGTRRRTGQEIAKAIDSIGGQIDAFTSKEYTCFYAKVLDEHLDVAIDLLSDIVLNPRFDPDDIEKERKVIFEEIRMVEDTPDERVYDLFSETFWRGHPLGLPIQGTQESIRLLTQRHLLDYFQASYHPGQMLVSAAGNLEHEATSEQIRRVFASLTNGLPLPATKPPRECADLALQDKDGLEQVHLCLGVKAFPQDSNDRFAGYVLNTLLGGTMSSRLFQNIREERGLAYSVYSSVSSFIDTGYLMVYAATGSKQARQVIELVLDEFRRLKSQPVSAQELRDAKDHLKGSLMLSLESTSSRMSNLAKQELYFGRQFPVEEILQGMEAVTIGNVQGLAQRLFDPRQCTLAALGRISDLRISRHDLEF
ncbi:MAG: pitrilysin family protein [Acidobacteriota bacterium]